MSRLDQYFTLPDGLPIQVALSGGRTSAYMLRCLLEANPGMRERDDVAVIFTNTGREMPETLDFVDTIGRKWDVNIVWLEYDIWPFGEIGWRVVDRETASEAGEPFKKAIVRKKHYLPGPFTRWCTQELKIRTAKRYLVRERGWKEWRSVLGIRADEPKRVEGKEGVSNERQVNWMPLYHAGVTKETVADYWSANGFDLGLQAVNGRTIEGNCDLCFLKSESSLAYMTKKYPERAAWWEEMEKLCNEVGAESGMTKERFLLPEDQPQAASRVRGAGLGLQADGRRRGPRHLLQRRARG